MIFTLFGKKIGKFIISKGNTSVDSFTVGTAVNKDMQLSSTWSYPSTSTPNNTNQVINASYWVDWGNDTFDNWGYFYLFDPQQNNYLGLQFSNRNLSDGVISTEIFTFNGRTFTIKHGYPVQGIYKFDISVNDNLDFRFGSGGNMGSDGSTINTNLIQSYIINNESFTLFYNFNIQNGKPSEAFYSYFIPYQKEINNTKTYSDFLIGSDNLYLYSVSVKEGLTVYFSKENDVKNWIINDLEIGKKN